MTGIYKGENMSTNIDESVFMAARSVVTGDVSIGKDSNIWYNAIIRGDLEKIEIGERSNVQDGCVIHVGSDSPVSIGDDVTIGHRAIIHGCTIGNNTLIGMGSIIMDGAQIGANCIIGAGSLVTKGTVIPEGSIAFGSPAKVVSTMKEEQIKENKKSAMTYIELARKAKGQV